MLSFLIFVTFTEYRYVIFLNIIISTIMLSFLIIIISRNILFNYCIYKALHRFSELKSPHAYPLLIQIVHKSLIDEVVKRLKSAYKQVKIGNPLEKGNLCGPLHTTAAVEAYKEAISEATALVCILYKL